MKPQTERFLAKARKLLADGDIMLSVQLNEAAGRAAYLVAFHAAQALIFERTDRTSKSHDGVHATFHRLSKDNRDVHPDHRKFLSRAYNLKYVADYDTEPGAEIPSERAKEYIETARLFMADMAALAAGSPANR